jgi:8-oxo-dGTP pyrophosphatase MutT (NUDIX family)
MCAGGYRPSVRAEQRVAVYGRLLASDGAIALVPSGTGDPTGDGKPDGAYELPGGRVRHGEHPREAVCRAAGAALGIEVDAVGVRDAFADVADLPGQGVSRHTVRLVYDLTAAPGWPSRLFPGARAVPPDGLAALALTPFTARALDLSTNGPSTGRLTGSHPSPPVRRVELRPVETGPDGAADGGPPKVQRVGAYALVPEDGRLLLTRYTGSGRWSLPGGGIDHGEQPLDAVRREVHEETGLVLADATLTDVDSVHFTGHAPDGTLEDFHAVRIVYRGAVPADAQPAVVEVGGSSDAAAWIPLAELDRYPVTGFVAVALRLLT